MEDAKDSKERRELVDRTGKQTKHQRTQTMDTYLSSFSLL